MPVQPQPVVLIVDDEPDLLELVSLTLSRMSLQTAHRRRPRQRAQAAAEPSASICA